MKINKQLELNSTHILLLALLFTIIVPSLAQAYVITSPYGWRIHPIYGGQKFHNGVDVADDYGVGIPSVQGGVVAEAVYGYNGGYGNYVTVRHADGSEEFFAHCQSLLVTAGQQIGPGQVVATIGSTGNSTGPHTHLSWYINGSTTDPLPYLQAAGWALNYGDFPPGGPMDTGQWLDEDVNPWNFGDFHEVAKQIRILLEDVSKQCTKGLGLVTEAAGKLLYVLMVIDLVLAVVLKFYEDDWFRVLCMKFLQYGFIILLFTHWREFTNIFVLDSFTQAGTIMGGGGTYIADNLSDPSKIVQKGAELAVPAFNYCSTYSGLQLTLNIHRVILALILGCAIFFCFLFIGLMFFLAYVEFYIICTLSIISVPFGVLKHARFISERGVGAVFSRGIKLMVMTFLVAMVVSTVKDTSTLQYDLAVYLRILASSMVLAFSVLTARTITKYLVGGTPVLKVWGRSRTAPA